MLYPKRTRTRDLFELNGIWDFARELPEGNYASDFIPEKQVAVPSSYNDLFTEEAFRMWDKGTWYRRRFTVPRMLREERLVLRFNSVSYRGEVFLNGVRLGDHETGYTPFEFDVDGHWNAHAHDLVATAVGEWLQAHTTAVRPASSTSAGSLPKSSAPAAGR